MPLCMCVFVWLGKPQMRFLQFDKCWSKPTRMRDCCQQTHSTIMARIYIYESIYITYKICMRSFITTRVWHREREGERIRYWQKWNVIVAIHWEIKFLRIQSSCVCERECVVRIEILSRAGGTKKSVCVKIWRAIIMRLLYCHNLRSVCTHLSVSAMKSASWGTFFMFVQIQNEKHKNESLKIAIQIHCAHKAFKWKLCIYIRDMKYSTLNWVDTQNPW